MDCLDVMGYLDPMAPQGNGDKWVLEGNRDHPAWQLVEQSIQGGGRQPVPM